MPPITPFVFTAQHNEDRKGTVLAGVKMAFQGHPELKISSMQPRHFSDLCRNQSLFSTDNQNRHPWHAIWRRNNLRFGTQTFVISLAEDEQIGMAMQIRLSANINRVAITHMERFKEEFPCGAFHVITAAFTVATLAREVFNPDHKIEVGVNYPANDKLIAHYSAFANIFGSTASFDKTKKLLTITHV